MVQQCARPLCTATAVASFNFDGLRRIVWLNALDDAPGSTAGDLCAQHAERLRPPLHWELRDLRSGTLDVTVVEPPPERPVPLAAKAAQPRRERSPLTDGEEARPEPDESTPLLARAFRAAG